MDKEKRVFSVVCILILTLMVLVSCGLPQQADNILHLPTCPVISFSEPAGVLFWMDSIARTRN